MIGTSNLWRERNIGRGYNYDAARRQNRSAVPCKYSRASWISCLNAVCTSHPAKQLHKYSEGRPSGSLTVRPSVRSSARLPARSSVRLVHLVVCTVNFEGVKDFQIPRCLLGEHGHHLEKFLEAHPVTARRRMS